MNMGAVMSREEKNELVANCDRFKNMKHSSRNTIELLGLWEKLHNPKFKLVEFDRFKNEAGYNHFVLSPKKWINATASIGLQSQSGRYGGTYAHIDIALEFLSCMSRRPSQLLQLLQQLPLVRET